MNVVQDKSVVSYLQERGLMDQYRKAVTLIEKGYFATVHLKKRQPKRAGIWYFRISQKYRALCIRHENTLIVFEIDDHQ